jgi:hypothetical protein
LTGASDQRIPSLSMPLGQRKGLGPATMMLAGLLVAAGTPRHGNGQR